MKKSLNVLLLVSSFLFFIGCEKTINNEVTYGDADTKGAILFIVGDIQNGVVDSGATVTININGEDVAVTTDSTGQALFEDIVVGSYLYAISKAGYHTIWGSVNVITNSSNSTIPLVEDQTLRVLLMRDGVTVSGSVVYNDVSGSIPLATGAVVQLSLDNPTAQLWENSNLVDTVDSLGRFSFANVPELTSYSINIAPFTNSNGVVYTQTSIINESGSTFGASVEIPVIALDFDAPRLQIVTHNLGTLANDSSALIFTFTDSIDTATAQVRVDDQNNTLASSFTVSADGKTVSITLDTDTWIVGEDYEVRLTLESVKGVAIDRTDERTQFTF